MSLTVALVDKDAGWFDLVKAINEATGLDAIAGIREEAGAHESGSGLSVAEIAKLNEYGSQDGRIPARPAFRQAWDAGVDGYATTLAREVIKVLDGDKTFVEALDRVILQVERDQVESVIALADPPNAPSTLAKKAPKTNPLIDSGQTVQSIDSAVYQDGKLVRPWKKGA